MADLTNYHRDEIIQFHWRNDADTKTPATTIYLGLYTTATDATGAGTEMTGGTPAYARVAVAFDDPAGTGTTQNTAAESVNSSGETVVAIAFLDASTAGNMIAHENLDNSLTSSDGDTLDWAAGDLEINFA